MKHSELIIENRYKIHPDISNKSLRKLCQYYKTIYDNNNKKRTIAKLQYILNVRHKKEKHKRVGQKQECAICYEVLTENNILITRCMHAYCDHCIVNYLRLYADSCPICRHFCVVDMFICDEHIDLLRMIELSPVGMIPTISEILVEQEGEEDDIIGREYFIIKYLHSYNRFILILSFLFFFYSYLFYLLGYFE